MIVRHSISLAPRPRATVALFLYDTPPDFVRVTDDGRARVTDDGSGRVPDLTARVDDAGNTRIADNGDIVITD